MNTESQKLELIQWLIQLQDAVLLQKIAEIKNEQDPVATSLKKRKRGSGKGFFANVADDFNEALSIFDDYTKK